MPPRLTSLTFLVVACFVPLAPAAPPAPPETSAPAALAAPALTVREGRLLRDGRPCHLIGVNYFDGFTRHLDPRPKRRRGAAEANRAAFATLAAYEVPFARFAAGGYYPDDWKLYRDDPAAYWALLDAFVADAEQAGIGLIPSLFWAFFTVPDLVGEPLSAWGEEPSATRAFMRRYTTEFVTRYRHSPAIWAWEMGNEYMLRADLPTPPERGTVVPERGTAASRTERDRLSSRAICAAYTDFARTVRALDPHRPITSGDALPRTGAHLLRTGKGWGADTPAQFAQVLREDTPPPMDLTSIHAYYRDGTGTAAEHRGLAGQPMRETVRAATLAAEAAGRPLFIGEFGANRESPPEAWRAETEAMFDYIVEFRVPLSAIWVFDALNPGVAHHNFKADNDKAYILPLIRDTNRRLAQPAN